MREIKFRAWNPNPWFMTAWVTLADIYNGFAGLNWKAVMQFTWLLDKNGKEIYEGDVVSMFPNMDWENAGNWIVVFENGEFKVDFFEKPSALNTRLFQWIEGWKIIWNIFENPNLLKNE